MTDSAPTTPWERWSWVIAGIWLVFLAYPIAETVQTTAPIGFKALTLVLLGAFATLYLLGYGAWSEHCLVLWFVLLALGIATTPVIGVEALALTPFLGAFAALLLPRPWCWWAALVSALLPVLSLLAGDFPMFFFLLVWPIIAFCVAIRIFSDLGEAAHETRGELALVAERERVARDVRDVLGHSLTALSIKAELAARLIEVDPARAKAELESIQSTAREALTEVRATVGGLRAANLEAELDTAPALMRDAGVGVEISGSAADTDPRHRALLAWVLREALTNVVRHADATHVRITLDRGGLMVADDGVGAHGTEGNGLRGMRERVTAAHGDLDLSPTPGGGTTLQVRLP